MNKVVWQWTRLEGLSVNELYAVIAAREAVFVVEQSCIYLDCDGLDQHAYHLIGWVDHNKTPSIGAYLRVVDARFKYDEPSIGRVLTTRIARGTGLGRELTGQAITNISIAYPGSDVRISAQHYLISFYNSFGFQAVSDPYDEDGIPHVEMVLKREVLLE